MTDLVKSSVVFNQEKHTYTLNGKSLSGITGMIHSQLFPYEYDNVSSETLQNAAEYGTFIHDTCELIDEIGIESDIQEAVFYKDIVERYGLLHEASEYLVSDEEHFASCIDKVYREGKNEFTLADIKTTSKFNEEYVRWQLSIYAYLFELQNPECKAVRLLGLWLRPDKYQVYEVERIPKEYVLKLIDCELNGKQFISDIAVSGVLPLPAVYSKIEDQIIEISNQKSFFEKKYKELTDGIKREMVKAGAYKFEGDRLSFTRSKETCGQKFDEESFKKDHADLYKKYLIDKTSASRLTLKIKK